MELSTFVNICTLLYTFGALWYTLVHFTCNLHTLWYTFVHLMYTLVHFGTLNVHFGTFWYTLIPFYTLLYIFVHFVCTFWTLLYTCRVYIQWKSTKPLLFTGARTSKQWRLIFVFDVTRPWQVDSPCGIIVSVVRIPKMSFMQP